MTVSIKVGPNGFDAAAYALNQIEDTDQNWITDGALRLYAELANQEFSKHKPLEYVVGNASSNSSPFTTLAHQSRYICTPANGFVVPPAFISDVLYLAAAGFTAADEASYIYLMPFSPINRFLLNPYILDTPSLRIIRSYWLGELAHYGQGNAGIVRDGTTGLLAIDLYPFPLETGIPIFVRYQGQHVVTTDPVTQNIIVPTIPPEYTREWAKLLWIELMEQESDRLMKNHMYKAGITTLQADSKSMEQRITRAKEEVAFALGAHTGTAITTR